MFKYQGQLFSEEQNEDPSVYDIPVNPSVPTLPAFASPRFLQRLTRGRQTSKLTSALQGEIRGPGLTPWQFVDISEEQIKHEITVQVEAPLQVCYDVWADRLNYLEWFDLISEVRQGFVGQAGQVLLPP